MKKKNIISLVFVIVLVSLPSYLFFRKSEIALNVSQRQDGSIDFLFDYKNVNGLLDIIVWEKESHTLLWNIKLGGFGGDKIKYGKIPSGFRRDNFVKQIYPWNNQPPKAIPLEKEIYVCLNYQYDDFVIPSARDDYYVFRIKPKLSVEKVEHPPANQWFHKPKKEIQK